MTLKLYHSIRACSLAAVVALEEAGADYEIIPMDLAAGHQRTDEYLRLNPKGRVPVLVDGDFVLTEVAAIMRYIAVTHPQAGLWPTDPKDDARCAEWCSWIASGVHVAYAHARRPERYASTEAGKAEVVAKGLETSRTVYEQVEQKLAGRTWAAGDRFSVADGYLTVFWTWGKESVLNFEMERDFPHWTALTRRVLERPASRRVIEKSGSKMPA